MRIVGKCCGVGGDVMVMRTMAGSAYVSDDQNQPNDWYANFRTPNSARYGHSLVQ
jgi:hypothetical protein